MSQYQRIESFIKELQRQQAKTPTNAADNELLYRQRELLDELHALMSSNGSRGWITKDDYIAIVVICLLGIILMLLVLLVQIVNATGIDAAAVILRFLAAN